MTKLFILPMLLLSTVPVSAQDEKPLVEIVEFDYVKDRRDLKGQEASAAAAPVREVLQQNRNFQRKARENLSPGAADPNAFTIDGRSAELERINREAASPKQARSVDGFTYRAKFTNQYKHPIEIVFWEVKFITGTDAGTAVRRQFICPMNVKAGEAKELSLFTTLGPSDVVDVKDPAARVRAEPAVSRVEFADGAVWQRLDWNFADEKKKIASALEKPWANEVCRGF